MNADYYIYEHWRLDTGECFYVGKGRRHRAKNMFNRSRLHHIVQDQLKASGLQIDIRFVMRDLTHEVAIQEEIKRIALRRSEGAPLVNFTNGGEGCSRRQTPEERAKRSATLKGRIISAEAREKMRQAWKTRAPMSEETRRKLSLARKGRFVGPLHPMWGKKHSPETIMDLRRKNSRPKSAATRAKLSAALKGRAFTPEWKAKIKAAKKNISEETRERMRASSRLRWMASPVSDETREKMRKSHIRRWQEKREAASGDSLS